MLYRSWLWPGSVHKSSYITRCVTQPYNRKKKQIQSNIVEELYADSQSGLHYSKLHHIWL